MKDVVIDDPHIRAWTADYEAAQPPRYAPYHARWQRRLAERDTLTALLSCKPLDVEMRRLQRAALRRLKNKGKR
jgi:hypothetical protein